MENNERKSIFNSIEYQGLENRQIVLDMGRRILAYEMATSGREIPPVCFNYEPDVTAFVEEYKRFNEKSDSKISFNTLMMRCIIEGIKSAPKLNSRLDYKYNSAKGTLTMYDHIDVNMPTILPDGSMQAINIKNADKMTLAEMDEYIKNLFDKVEDSFMFSAAQVDLALEQTFRFIKQGKLITGTKRLIGAAFGKERIKITPHDNLFEFFYALYKRKSTTDTKNVITKRELEEGTVMITNVGSLYKELKGNVTMFEIIPPEIFAVAIGSMQRRPEIKQDENGNEIIKAATIVPLALVFDHKAVDFGDLIPLIKRLDDIFANPEQMYNW